MAQKVLTLDPLTGKKKLIEISEGLNFSYKEILSTEEIEVPARQQMIVNDRVRIDGQLKVSGEVYVYKMPTPEPFPELPDDNFSFYEIVVPKEVKATEEMVLSQSCKISSQLRVAGRLAILGTGTPPTTNDESIPNVILAGQSFSIGLNFEKYFRQFLKISGQLKCAGSFVSGV